MFDKISKFIFLFLLSLSNQALLGQDEIAGMFDKSEILELTIYADLEGLLTDVGQDRGSHNAFLVYKENGSEKRLDIELKTRGNFRRKPEICTFPPH